jgi:hypothetical protein
MSATPAFIPPSRPPQPVTEGAWDFCFYMLSASVVNTYKRATTSSEVAVFCGPPPAQSTAGPNSAYAGCAVQVNNKFLGLLGRRATPAELAQDCGPPA